MGGQERSLLFGVNGYINYIREVSGIDPFEWLERFDKLRDGDDKELIRVVTEDVVILAYAGINSFLDSTDQPNIPIEKVAKWCNGISIEEASLIVRNAFGSIASDTPGELKARTETINGSNPA